MFQTAAFKKKQRVTKSTRNETHYICVFRKLQSGHQNGILHDQDFLVDVWLTCGVIPLFLVLFSRSFTRHAVPYINLRCIINKKIFIIVNLCSVKLKFCLIYGEFCSKEDAKICCIMWGRDATSMHTCA